MSSPADSTPAQAPTPDGPSALELLRAYKCMAAVHEMLRRARKHGGKGLRMEVDDLLTLFEAFESGALDHALNDPNPVEGPIYSRVTQ